jgi:hypothetical protein
VFSSMINPYRLTNKIMTSIFARTFAFIFLILFIPFSVSANANGSGCVTSALQEALLERENSSAALPLKPSSNIYSERTELIDQAKKTLSGADLKEFENWYYSHFFFDRQQILRESLESESFGIHEPQSFKTKGEDPFLAYQRTREKLFQKSFYDLTLDDIKAVQRDLLSKDTIADSAGRSSLGTKARNSENIPDSALGRIRGGSEVYYDPNDAKTIRQSPIRLTTGKEISDLPKSDEAIRANNPKLTPNVAENKVWYTRLKDWESYRAHLSPETTSLIERLKAEIHPVNDRDWLNPKFSEARQRFITEILDNTLSSFKKNLALAKTQDDVIKSSADFYHEYMSIHPFLNGNGRSARLLIERALEQRGLPPPIWTAFGEDVVLSSNDFRSLFEDSVNLSNRFHKDLQDTIAAGRDYHFVPTAFLSPEISAAQAAYVDPEEFMTWVANSSHKVNGPADSAIQQSVADFEKWKNDFKYSDGHTIELATPTFQKTFGKLSPTPEAFQTKLEKYYDNKPIYRGVPSYHVPTNQEIVEVMVKPTGVVNGMGVKGDLEEIKSLFDQFNVEMARETKMLEKRAKKHARGFFKGYKQSGYASFSYDPEIADGFSVSDEKGVKTQYFVEAKSRKPASLRTAEAAGKLKKTGYEHEEEELLLGSADPESIELVKVKQAGQDGEKIAIRKSFDTVALMELDSAGVIKKQETYHIARNGEIKLIDTFVPESKTIRLTPYIGASGTQKVLNSDSSLAIQTNLERLKPAARVQMGGLIDRYGLDKSEALGSGLSNMIEFTDTKLVDQLADLAKNKGLEAEFEKLMTFPGHRIPDKFKEPGLADALLRSFSEKVTETDKKKILDIFANPQRDLGVQTMTFYREILHNIADEVHPMSIDEQIVKIGNKEVVIQLKQKKGIIQSRDVTQSDWNKSTARSQAYVESAQKKYKIKIADPELTNLTLKNKDSIYLFHDPKTNTDGVIVGRNIYKSKISAAAGSAAPEKMTVQDWQFEHKQALLVGVKMDQAGQAKLISSLDHSIRAGEASEAGKGSQIIEKLTEAGVTGLTADLKKNPWKKQVAQLIKGAPADPRINGIYLWKKDLLNTQSHINLVLGTVVGVDAAAMTGMFIWMYTSAHRH